MSPSVALEANEAHVALALCGRIYVHPKRGGRQRSGSAGVYWANGLRCCWGGCCNGRDDYWQMHRPGFLLHQLSVIVVLHESAEAERSRYDWDEQHDQTSWAGRWCERRGRWQLVTSALQYNIGISQFDELLLSSNPADLRLVCVQLQSIAFAVHPPIDISNTVPKSTGCIAGVSCRYNHVDLGVVGIWMSSEAMVHDDLEQPHKLGRLKSFFARNRLKRPQIIFWRYEEKRFMESTLSVRVTITWHPA